MTIGGMTVTWAMPSATAEQWVVMAVVAATPVVGLIAERMTRRFLRWLWSGGA